MPTKKRPDNSSEPRRSPPAWPQSRPRLCNRKPLNEYTEEDLEKLRRAQDEDIRKLSDALPEQLAEYEKE